MGNLNSKKKEVPYSLTLEEKISIHKAFHSMCMSRPAPVTKTINEKLFKDFMGFPGDLADRLFLSLGPEEDGELNFVNFANGLVKFTMGAAQNAKMQHFAKLFTSHADVAMTSEEFTNMLKALYMCSMAVMGEVPVPPPDKDFLPITTGIFQKCVDPKVVAHSSHPTISFAAYTDFVASYAPRLLLPFEMLIYESIFMFNPETDLPMSSPRASLDQESEYTLHHSQSIANIQKTVIISDFVVPRLDKESKLLSPVHVWSLLNLNAHCVTYNDNLEVWSRLYSSDEDGFSFNRFSHHVFGYRGPTLLVIEDKKGFRFGAYVSEGWKDAASPFANTGTYLFALTPEFHVCRMTGTKGVYCNIKTRNQAHGIGFGGDFMKQEFHLFISDTFDKGTLSVNPLGFEAGNLIGAGNHAFDIAAVEVWGLGGLEALSEQDKTRRRHEREALRRRRVDRRAVSGVWDDNADKFILDLMGVQGGNLAAAFLSPEELRSMTSSKKGSQS